MNFREYQLKSRKTAVYPLMGSSLLYPTLGLAGETGEVVEKVKKAWRAGAVLPRDDIKKELGDVLWYLAQLATELHLDLNDIASANLKKLADRHRRGVVCGEGDNR